MNDTVLCSTVACHFARRSVTKCNKNISLINVEITILTLFACHFHFIVEPLQS